MLDQKIIPTAKHSPGLGRVAADTHLFAAGLETPVQILGASDWLPFRAVLKHPGAAVMLAHVALTGVDAAVPVSQSRRMVSGLHQHGWRLAGIAITDDLSMGAVEHSGLCPAVEGALNAGVDLLLVSWDTDKVYPSLQCALDALKEGRLDAKMLEQSASRLDKL
jgi:beta-N-acetylhexosaminidase